MKKRTPDLEQDKSPQGGVDNVLIPLVRVLVKGPERTFVFEDESQYAPLPLRHSNIPKELFNMRMWIVWRPNKTGKKIGKIPINPKTLFPCASTDLSACVTGPEALTVFQKRKDLAGIGLVLHEDWPYVGIDIDNCLKDNKVIDPVAQNVLDLIPSYTEQSPSGKGLRVIAKGKLPEGRRRKGSLEMYTSGRFLTITGHRAKDLDVCACPRGVNAVHKKYLQGEVQQADIPSETSTILTDDQVLEHVRGSLQGPKFHDLWANRDGGNASDADMSLCCILAFWCRRDKEQMDRLFRKSKRMRPKWDENRGSRTYGDITVRNACSQTKEVFGPLGPENIFTTVSGDGWLPEETTEDEIVRRYNKDHCLVLLEGKYRVFRISDRKLIHPTDFRGMYGFRLIDDPGCTYKREVELWEHSPSAARYAGGLYFDPSEEPWDEKHTPSSTNGRLSSQESINLWTGMALEPMPGPCELIKDHIFNVICRRDKELYHWLINWCAHMIQFPHEKPGTVPVLQSGQGTGKGSFVEVLLRVFGKHATTIINMDQITGRFNRLLEDKVLIFADEAMYAGSKAAADRFKSLITSPTLTVEPKGVDPYEQRSYTRFILATNAAHAAYIESDDRRYTVLSVDEKWASAKNKGGEALVERDEYFRVLWDEIHEGGTEAFLAYLLTVEVDQQLVRRCMDTQAKKTQRRLSLESPVQWLTEVAYSGEIELDGVFAEPVALDEKDSVLVSLRVCWNAYREYSSRDRYAVKQKEAFIACLRKFGVMKCLGSPEGEGRRVQCLSFPGVVELRKILEEVID